MRVRARIALVCTLAAIPLYTMVHQEFIPSSSDEGEFTVGVTAPEGTTMAAMDQLSFWTDYGVNESGYETVTIPPSGCG